MHSHEHTTVGALLRAAAQRYLTSGRTVMHFVHGKLRHDPLYVELLRSGALSNASALLDLGCGRAALFSLLVEAREWHARGEWPASWPTPPTLRHMQGIELSRRDVRIANLALHPHAEVTHDDLVNASIRNASFITLFDVLHYLDANTQQHLLVRIADALEPGGTLLLRVGDPDAGWRHAFTYTIDCAAWALRGHAFAGLHFRRIDEWTTLLRYNGFAVDVAPMQRGTPFANVLLTARRVHA